MEPVGRLLVIGKDNPGGGRLIRKPLKEIKLGFMFPDAVVGTQTLDSPSSILGLTDGFKGR